MIAKGKGKKGKGRGKGKRRYIPPGSGEESCIYCERGTCQYGDRCANKHLGGDGRDVRESPQNNAPGGLRSTMSLGQHIAQGKGTAKGKHTMGHAIVQSPQPWQQWLWSQRGNQNNTSAAHLQHHQ